MDNTVGYRGHVYRLKDIEALGTIYFLFDFRIKKYLLNVKYSLGEFCKKFHNRGELFDIKHTDDEFVFSMITRNYDVHSHYMPSLKELDKIAHDKIDEIMHLSKRQPETKAMLIREKIAFLHTVRDVIDVKDVRNFNNDNADYLQQYKNDLWSELSAKITEQNRELKDAQFIADLKHANYTVDVYIDNFNNIYTSVKTVDFYTLKAKLERFLDVGIFKIVGNNSFAHLTPRMIWDCGGEYTCSVFTQCGQLTITFRDLYIINKYLL